MRAVPRAQDRLRHVLLGPISFTGILISTVGVLAIRQARQPGMRLFAAIPLLFGIQLLTEG